MLKSTGRETLDEVGFGKSSALSPARLDARKSTAKRLFQTARKHLLSYPGNKDTFRSSRTGDNPHPVKRLVKSVRCGVARCLRQSMRESRCLSYWSGPKDCDGATD